MGASEERARRGKMPIRGSTSQGTRNDDEDEDDDMMSEEEETDDDDVPWESNNEDGDKDDEVEGDNNDDGGMALQNAMFDIHLYNGPIQPPLPQSGSARLGRAGVGIAGSDRFWADRSDPDPRPETPATSAAGGIKPHLFQGRVFSAPVVSHTTTATKEGSSHAHKGKKPAAATSRSGRTVIVENLRIRLDEDELVMPKDKIIPTIPTSNRFAPLHQKQKEEPASS
ncbi:hypothetical protein Taro_054776 [Colocasia esculenta]|uniref:Uncharacterized protein n=1 Tax=Colocasia esculenta TaxID=4460 RepID=A0A843XRL4_COLES|nr:hypothetical protein [Colocasia esculenta]